MKQLNLLLIVLFIGFINCSKSEDITDDTFQNTNCNLLEINCNTPFQDNTNQPNLPNTQQITVANTSLEAVENALMQIDDANRKLFFPAGIYKLPVVRNNQDQILNRTILAFNAINNLEIYGEVGTIFQLDFEQESASDLQIIRQKQVALLIINASENVYIHDIELKGNFEFTGSADDVTNFYTEHRNILVRDSKKIYLENLKSTKAEGDAISIVASVNADDTPNFTSDVFVTNVEVDNLNRNGISIAGSGITNSVQITQCTFGEKIRTQQIDFEPTENASSTINVSDVIISNNTFNTLQQSSNSDGQAAISVLTVAGVGLSCITIKDNNIKNDIQLLRGASNISLVGNTNIPSLVITNNANKINVSENSFNLNLTETKAIQRDNSGILITNVANGFGNFEPSNMVFLNNIIQQENSINGTRVLKALSINNADLITASANSIQFNTNFETTGFSINFESLNGFEVINFINNNNQFQGVLSENEIKLFGEVEKIIVSENCN